MSKPSLQHPSTYYTANRYIASGLLCLCAAMLCFGVGAFLDNPTSIWGIIFIVIGVLLALATNVCFMVYWLISRKNRS
jgi:uncharacterized membrane-anchored protein